MTFALTVTALVAFAANSVLCRLALGADTIDPYSFTAVRLASGALVLAVLGGLRRQPGFPASSGSWKGAGLLVLYALPFSLAYVRIETGTGALLLFGAVQVTMLGRGLATGERPRPVEWLGVAGAVAGLVYLVSPGISAPDPLGAAAMVVAGIGWGGYSIAGRGVADPAAMTAGNFRRAALAVVPPTLLAAGWLSLSAPGVLLAAGSGALASGLGYAVWYTVLGSLTLTRAALVQLAVPVIAAAGGVLVVGESITLRLFLASAVILGSIALGVLSRPER